MERATGRLTISARKKGDDQHRRSKSGCVRTAKRLRNLKKIKLLENPPNPSRIFESSKKTLHSSVISSRLFHIVSYASGCSSRKDFYAPIFNGGFSSSWQLIVDSAKWCTTLDDGLLLQV
jgi:hypothetical protein